MHIAPFAFMVLIGTLTVIYFVAEITHTTDAMSDLIATGIHHLIY